MIVKTTVELQTGDRIVHSLDRFPPYLYSGVVERVEDESGVLTIYCRGGRWTAEADEKHAVEERAQSRAWTREDAKDDLADTEDEI